MDVISFLDFLESLSHRVQGYLGISADTFANLVLTLVALVAYSVTRTVLSRIYNKRIDEVGRRYVASKTTTYLLGFILLIVLVRIWFNAGTGTLAYLGILSAGVAVALQDPLVNLAGWLFIIFRKPFSVSDRIQIGEHRGDVIDIRLFQFSILEIGNWVDADQSSGRVLHIPNGLVFKQALANYTQGFNFIWDELAIMLTFESDWAKAKEILLEIANRNLALSTEQAEREVRQAASKYMIFYQHLKPIIWTSVADSGVVLTMRYLCEPRKRRSTQTKIWEDVLIAFAQTTDIDFAYPTQRFYSNPSEGKPGKEG